MLKSRWVSTLAWVPVKVLFLVLEVSRLKFRSYTYMENIMVIKGNVRDNKNVLKVRLLGKQGAFFRQV